MSQAEINVVHETETQRRHARIKLPARIVFNDKDGTSHSLSLTDLSASGFGVQTDSSVLEKRRHYSGDLIFKLNTIEFRLPIKFSVVHCLESEKKAGCEFDELNQEQISILRLFISKYLAGDLTKSSDILTTLTRDNFTKARKDSTTVALNGWKKVRALTGTVLAAGFGVMALLFILNNLYQNYFVTRAVTALVDIEMETVRAPADGYFELVADMKNPVEAGAALATISSPVLEHLKQTTVGSLTPEEIKALLPDTSNSVVKSPGKGRILNIRAEKNTYTRKGDVLFDFIRSKNTPYITAVFKYTDADDLQIGKQVSLQFPGDEERFSGMIQGLKVDIQSSLSTVTATIQPDKKVSLERMEMPIYVRVASGPNVLSFLQAANAIEMKTGK